MISWHVHLSVSSRETRYPLWPNAATWGTIPSLPGTGCSWDPLPTAAPWRPAVFLLLQPLEDPQHFTFTIVVGPAFKGCLAHAHAYRGMTWLRHMQIMELTHVHKGLAEPYVDDSTTQAHGSRGILGPLGTSAWGLVCTCMALELGCVSLTVAEIITLLLHKNTVAS